MKDIKAIILAGGKGTRLKPYTTNFPKPLMPIGDKPILEIVINGLKEAGIKDIIITTGHLSELIRTFFGDGEKFGVNISYSIEHQPLGTAGPIKPLKDELKENFLVMNGDVLTDINYSQMIDYHIKNNNIATVGVVSRKVHIDYGLVEIDKKNNFLSWEEKPTMKYLVSMGIYIFAPDALRYLPSEDFFNLPDFIQRLKKNDLKIMSYMHEGFWLDIGRPEDYENACRNFEE